MKKINLYRLKVKNFNSWESGEFYLNTNLFIEGINGSGKTSIVEAIYFGLYGKPLDSFKKINDLIREGTKEGVVQLDIYVNDDLYSIHRTIKKVKRDVEIYINDKRIDQPKSINNFIYNLVGEPDLFKKLFFFDSSSFIDYFKLKTEERRKLITNIFNLEIVDGYIEKIKDKLKVLENKISGLEEKKNNYRDIIKEKKNTIEIIKNTYIQIKKNISEIKIDFKGLENLKKSIDCLKKYNDKILIKKEGLLNNEEEIQELRELKSYIEKYSVINNYIKKYPIEIDFIFIIFKHFKHFRDIKKVIKFVKLVSPLHEKLLEMGIESLNKTPSKYCSNKNCGAKLKNYDNVFKGFSLANKTLDVFKLKDKDIIFKLFKDLGLVGDLDVLGCEKIKKELEGLGIFNREILDNDLKRREEYLKKILSIDKETLDKKNSLYKKEIKILEDNIKKLYLSKGKYDGIKKLLVHKNNLTKNLSDEEESLNVNVLSLKEFENKFKDIELILKKDKSYYYDITTIYDLVKGNIFKNYIMGKYLPEFENRFEYYLNNFGCNFNFKLKNIMNLEEENSYGFRNYGKLSKGQKKRVNFSILLSLMVFYEAKGIIPNFIIFDELESAGLDEDGINALFNIICELDKKFILISHNKELIPNNIDRIKITVKNGVSSQEHV